MINETNNIMNGTCVRVRDAIAATPAYKARITFTPRNTLSFFKLIYLSGV